MVDPVVLDAAQDLQFCRSWFTSTHQDSAASPLNSLRVTGLSLNRPHITEVVIRLLCPDAPHGHAEVLAANLDGDVLAFGLSLNQGRDLVGQPLLDLELVADQVDDAAELRQAEDLAARDVADRPRGPGRAACDARRGSSLRFPTPPPSGRSPPR